MKKEFEKVCWRASRDKSARLQEVLHMQCCRKSHFEVESTRDKDPHQEHKTARAIQTIPAR